MLINKKKQIFLLSMLSTLLVACNDDNDHSNVDQPVEAKPLELNILHINDHHSHLDEESIKFKTNVGTGDEEFSVTSGGFARVASLINQLTAEKKNAFKIHAGDATTGDLYYNLTDGKADADAMNTVCFDTFTPGNHEFDAKDDGLKKFIGFLDQGTCKEKTQVLTANVSFGASSPLYKTNRILKSQVFEKDGVKFAIIGLTVAKKPKILLSRMLIHYLLMKSKPHNKKLINTKHKASKILFYKPMWDMTSINSWQNHLQMSM
ncbi:metallophosphoesterase [Acinetobacter bereziniae]|nr:metallophosphoesterase [Acinetobacter bereziniae]